MNSAQFWTLIGIASFTVILVLSEIALALDVQSYQVALQANVPTIQRGQQAEGTYRQLVERIYQVGQQSHDQRLMDLLARQGVTVTMSAPPSLAPAEGGSSPSSTDATATAPQSPK